MSFGHEFVSCLRDASTLGRGEPGEDRQRRNNNLFEDQINSISKGRVVRS
jgi:hypothetical protein